MVIGVRREAVGLAKLCDLSQAGSAEEVELERVLAVVS